MRRPRHAPPDRGRHRRLAVEVLEDRLPVAESVGAAGTVALLAGTAHAAPPPPNLRSLTGWP
jgi:hypothetical protein